MKNNHKLGTSIYIYRVAASFLFALLVTFSSMAADIFDYPVLDFSGDFIAGSGISDDDKKSLIPVGTVSVWTQEKVPEFWLECDGRAVDGVRYPELKKMMSHLPDYRGRFLQGTDTANSVGKRVEAGLPNITAYVNFLLGSGAASYKQTWARGAIKKRPGEIRTAKGGDDDYAGHHFDFDASWSRACFQITLTKPNNKQ